MLMNLVDPLAAPFFLRELQGCGRVAEGLAAVWRDPLDLAALPRSPDRCLRLERRGVRTSVVTLPDSAMAMAARLDPLIRVLEMAGWLGLPRAPQPVLRLQAHDEEPDDPDVLRLDAPAGFASAQYGVIPDPYCLGSRGYLLFRRGLAAAPPPPWRQRRPVVIWRGATTGSRAITPARLAANPRVQLCEHSRRWPDRLDARITSVVQCRDAEAQQAVTRELEGRGLLAPVLEPLEMAQCRWILDIDGNVNSWGLLWKLLSGSCVLRVAIRADLSDLEQQLDWCLANPEACEAIAAAAQQLALDVLEDLGVDLHTALSWSLDS